jgi:two-component system, OmpR family, response regulator
MNEDEKITIFLVDDDALFLKLLEIDLLENADFIIETFATGELCVANLSHCPDLIVLDYHLDGIDPTAMNGLEALDQIKEYDSAIPVIMLSSQDKIEVAINCMHYKAFDYVVKSETAFMRLRRAITTVFRHQKMEKELSWYMERM